MNLFRSEEHIRSWSRFDPAAEQGIVPLADLVMLFSLDMFKKRLEPDYATRSRRLCGRIPFGRRRTGQNASILANVSAARPRNS